ncbi:MAG: IS21 family transposase [Candidatus Dormibacteria bacterium]
MLGVEEWAEIRRLHFGEKLKIKAIARRLGLARNTVRTAVRREEPPRYQRRRRSSATDEYEQGIRALLQEYPRMPASVIAERLGWNRSESVFRSKVAQLRPLYLPPEPYQRTEYQPGELAQWDIWFPETEIPVGAGVSRKRMPVLVGTTAYSRWMVGRMIPSREVHDLLCGHWECLLDLGAVPRAGVYDNEGGIGRRRGGRVQLTEEFQAFRGVLGMKAVVLRPRFPEGKGVVERSNGYLETSFLPGRLFGGIEDFNQQLSTWLDQRANRRWHRIMRCRPLDRIATDKAAMLPLPPVAPEVAWHFSTRIGRDHYVRVLTCDYSVHPRYIGRLAQVRVDLNSVLVTVAGEEAARHSRSLLQHQTITDPVHVQARQQLQQHHRDAALATPATVDVEERDLAVYDRLPAS